MKMISFLRSILGTVLFGLLTASLATVGIISNFLFNRRKFDNWIMMTWGRLSLKFFNVEAKVYGEENLKKTKGAVVLFNHSSFADAFVMCGYLYNIRYGAKIELFKIPLFGTYLRRLGVLPIARAKREEVFKVYEEAKIRFARGEKFGLSPEGGRFHGDQLYPFKAGPFIFAIQSQVPVIPVVIKGAYDVWPKGKILANSDRWRRTIEMHVLAPVSTEDYTVENRAAVQDKIYKLMNDIYVT